MKRMISWMLSMVMLLGTLVYVVPPIEASAVSVPEVVTYEPEINGTKLTMYGELKKNGGADITEYGFDYYVNGDNDTKRYYGGLSKGDLKDYTISLEPGDSGYYYFYAKNSAGKSATAGQAQPFSIPKKAVSDKQKPMIDPISASPSKTAVYGTSVKFSTDASDDVELEKIELLIDDEVEKTVNSGEKEDYISYTAKKLSVGTHTIKVIATDTSGKSNYTILSYTITDAVKDTQAPMINPITASPSGSAKYGTTVKFSTKVSDDVELKKIELLIDGVAEKTVNTDGKEDTISFSTKNLTVGTHTVKVIASDPSGKSNDTSINYVVTAANNDVAKPMINPITADPSGSAMSGEYVTFSTKASDETKLKKLELLIDGTVEESVSATGKEKSISYKTKKLTVGTHTVLVRATDAAGNVNQTQISYVIYDDSVCLHPESALKTANGKVVYPSGDITEKTHGYYTEYDVICGICNEFVFKYADMGNIEAHSYNNQGVCVCGAVKKAAPQTGLPFTDVTTSTPYFDSIVYCYKNGLFQGQTNTIFNPNGSMTRATVMTVLANMSGINSNQYTKSSFKDVNKNAWYAPYIEWGYQKKIANGNDKGEFNPDTNVTIQEAIQYLYNYAKPAASRDGSISRFSDAKNVSGWAVTAMTWAVNNGIYAGTNGKLNPQKQASRALMAELLYNFSENYVPAQPGKDMLYVYVCNQPVLAVENSGKRYANLNELISALGDYGTFVSQNAYNTNISVMNSENSYQKYILEINLNGYQTKNWDDVYAVDEINGLVSGFCVGAYIKDAAIYIELDELMDLIGFVRDDINYDPSDYSVNQLLLVEIDRLQTCHLFSEEYEKMPPAWISMINNFQHEWNTMDYGDILTKLNYKDNQELEDSIKALLLSGYTLVPIEERAEYKVAEFLKTIIDFRKTELDLYDIVNTASDSRVDKAIKELLDSNVSEIVKDTASLTLGLAFSGIIAAYDDAELTNAALLDMLALLYKKEENIKTLTLLAESVENKRIKTACENIIDSITESAEEDAKMTSTMFRKDKEYRNKRMEIYTDLTVNVVIACVTYLNPALAIVSATISAVQLFDAIFLGDEMLETESGIYRIKFSLDVVVEELNRSISRYLGNPTPENECIVYSLSMIQGDLLIKGLEYFKTKLVVEEERGNRLLGLLSNYPLYSFIKWANKTSREEALRVFDDSIFQVSRSMRYIDIYYNN